MFLFVTRRIGRPKSDSAFRFRFLSIEERKRRFIQMVKLFPG
jgi:hypothetical protein